MAELLWTVTRTLFTLVISPPVRGSKNDVTIGADAPAVSAELASCEFANV